MPGHLSHRYLLALGSNVRHFAHGRPQGVLAAAMEALEQEGLRLVRRAPVIASRPIGPSRRAYANGAVLVDSTLEPEALLAVLKRVEARFGQRRGRRWAARVLDCDIILWSGGAWASRQLTIPHAHFRQRDFVLRPAHAIAPTWRDPLSGRSLRQLHQQLRRNKRMKCATRP